MSPEDEILFDSLETHFRCILAWIDSDFDISFEEEKQFDIIINRTKKRGSILEQDIKELKELYLFSSLAKIC